MQKISLHVREIIGSGVCANVYLNGGRAFKVIRSGEATPDQIKLDLYDRELKAVQAVAKIPDLAIFAPKFHGVFELQSMLDHGHGENILRFFTRNVLCFDFIPGTGTKFETAIQSNSRLEELLARFAKHKIDIRDCTIFDHGRARLEDARIVDYTMMV
jgi:hypothetical protein